MGSGMFNASAYHSYTRTTAGKTTDEVFASRSIHKNLNPKGVKLRESRDSSDNPNSTPIIVALDVTGSMGMIVDVIAREGLGTLFNEILDRKLVSDPHVMFMAVGDAHSDKAPLQVSQFEADNRIVEQLTQIWIERGGGGNSFESYNLPWYFAAEHTEHDSLIKRAKRGYLFTIGDEQAPRERDLTRDHLKKIIGDDVERDITTGQMLSMAQRKYDVFHIIIEEGDYARDHLGEVVDSWRSLLGQRVITLSDHKRVAQTVVSTIELLEGGDAKSVASRFGSAVYESVKSLPKAGWNNKTPLALKN